MSDAAQSVGPNSVGPNSVGLIPDQLLSNIKKGDCVLFLGADLPLGYDGAPLSRPELAQALAKQYDLPLDRSWPETVQCYLDRFSNDRAGLIAFLRSHLAGPALRPGPTHQAIARAGFRAIVTAWYDDLLEKALRDAGCRVTRVVRNKSEAYTQEGEPEVVVVKLYGCLSDEGSLVLRPSENDDLLLQLDAKLKLVTGFCQLRPPLLIGFDLADAMPRLLYARALMEKVEQQRQAFAVWPQSLDKAQVAWAGRNIVFISAETTPFLESLSNQLPTVVSSGKGAIRVNRPPFKFLDYYEPQDADIFCGRDTESQIVARLILSHRLLTLFGPSGAGKTSLLLAGVLPRLAAEGYQHVYVRALDDPLLAVRKAIAARAGQPVGEVGSLRAFLASMLRAGAPASRAPLAEEQPTSYRTQLRQVLVERFSLDELHSLCFEMGLDYDRLAGDNKDGKARELIEYLDRRVQLADLVAAGRRIRTDIDWSALTRAETQPAPALLASDRLVVVLDQLEELFLRVGSRQRTDFFGELAAALAQPERDVRFVFCLREDHLFRLDEARDHLPDILANSYRLKPLDRANARLAITEPAGRAGVKVEPALADALVGREGMDGGLGGDLVEADGSVPPPSLQIAMDRLYRAALGPNAARAAHAARDPDAPPPPGLTLTLAQYQSLGSASAILAAYVDEGLARLSALKGDDGAPLGADAALGAAILKVMVTSQKTKAALTHADLIEGLAEAGELNPADEADCKLAERTRLGLERVRLLRGFQREGRALYEPAHDHMAAEIARRISEAEMETKVARELLRREMDNWLHTGKKLLIPREALKLIHERRDDLRRLTQDELELILRSGLAHGYEAPYWFDRACKGSVPADKIALEGLKGESFRTRAAAVSALAQLGAQFIQPIIGMLADDYPQVRVAAILALEKLQPTGEWRKHLRYECHVPAGKFIIGYDKEAHEVGVAAFYIGKYPVTNAEYKCYMDDLGRAFQIPPGKETHPVAEVSWYDARDYGAWAAMRLLTEAEWEKAASWEEDKETRRPGDKGLVQQLVGKVFKGGEKASGRKRNYPWGDEFDKTKCNTSESKIGTTTPVGKYSPQGDSPYGCADMAGNVWEWTSSLKEDYPYKADDGREDMASSNIRVLRGGSFFASGTGAPCASRDGYYPSGRYGAVGFRVGVAAPFSPTSAL